MAFVASLWAGVAAPAATARCAPAGGAAASACGAGDLVRRPGRRRRHNACVKQLASVDDAAPSTEPPPRPPPSDERGGGGARSEMAGQNHTFDGLAREDCSWEDVEALVDTLAQRLADHRFDVVMGITRGGMVPATLVCERFGLRNLLCATVLFYTDSGTRFYGLAQPRLLHFPDAGLIEGRRVLIVDDVWDSGTTARSVKERVRRAGGKPTVAVLHFKPQRNRFKDDSPDHHAITTDSWIHYPWEPAHKVN